MRRKKFTYVSEEHSASLFRVEEQSMSHETVVFNSTLKDFWGWQIFLQNTDILDIVCHLIQKKYPNSEGWIRLILQVGRENGKVETLPWWAH